jgi:hypothetical protein
MFIQDDTQMTYMTQVYRALLKELCETKDNGVVAGFDAQNAPRDGHPSAHNAPRDGHPSAQNAPRDGHPSAHNAPRDGHPGRSAIPATQIDEDSVLSLPWDFRDREKVRGYTIKYTTDKSVESKQIDINTLKLILDHAKIPYSNGIRLQLQLIQSNRLLRRACLVAIDNWEKLHLIEQITWKYYVYQVLGLAMPVLISDTAPIDTSLIKGFKDKCNNQTIDEFVIYTIKYVAWTYYNIYITSTELCDGGTAPVIDKIDAKLSRSIIPANQYTSTWYCIHRTASGQPDIAEVLLLDKTDVVRHISSVDKSTVIPYSHFCLLRNLELFIKEVQERPDPIPGVAY